MPDVAIAADRLTKTYLRATSSPVIGRTLRDDIGRLGRRPGRAANVALKALDDVTFDVAQGERLGVIGKNGAGKSTLLKILSRVTRPTSGHATVYGRLGALLEVGMGFHPELTGRENVYLSGAILGMTRAEIDARFDEIVAFSELEAFLDTPVKRYSSGMYARLGFAVAAHLRPAILLVDEVLSVGDLAFQGKCLARMKALATEGTAVLFVSHNLLTVTDFCTRAIHLDHGRVVVDGPASEVVRAYRRSVTASVAQPGAQDGALPVRVNGVPAGAGVVSQALEPLVIETDLTLDRPMRELILNVVLETADGQPAMHLRSDLEDRPLVLEAGGNTIGVRIPSFTVGPGDYWLWVRAVSNDPLSPLLQDSDRVFLEVSGPRTTDSIAWPAASFFQAPRQ